MKEKISVLIPVYNRELYIKEAVESIRNQTYNNLDIIIYDDGSTDNTLQIINMLAKNDKRIKIIEGKKNHGGVYAKVQLIKASNTDIICYQDSDDISHLSRIELQSNLIKQYNAVFCGWEWLIKRGSHWIPRASNNSRCATSIMYRKDMNILPNPKYVLGGGDCEFIMRYLKKHPKWIILPDKLYCIRNHNDRIGIWKRKIRKKIPNEMILKMSYSELIAYYKEHYEK